MTYLERFARRVVDPEKQLELLDARRLRRNSDPLPSHVSAENASQGLAKRHRDQILDLIRAHPGRDCSGLVVEAQHEGLFHLDRASVSKRLSELHRMGLITHPETTGKARRWFAA